MEIWGRVCMVVPHLGYLRRKKTCIFINRGYEAYQNRSNRGYEAYQNRRNRGYEAYQNRSNRGYEAYQNRSNRGFPIQTK